MEREYGHAVASNPPAAREAGMDKQDIDTADRAFAWVRRADEILDEAQQLEGKTAILRPGPARGVPGALVLGTD